MPTPDFLTSTDGIEPQDIVMVWSRRNRDTRGVSFGEFNDSVRDVAVEAVASETDGAVAAVQAAGTAGVSAVNTAASGAIAPIADAVTQASQAATTAAGARTDAIQARDAAAVSAQAAADALVGTAKTADLAAATGAAGVGTTLGLTGAKQRTQQEANADSWNVRMFLGIDPTGATDSYAGLVYALTQAAAAGRKLVAEGTFLLNTRVSIPTGSKVDFRNAKFIGGAGVSGSAVFWTVGNTDIEVIGGHSEMTGATPNKTIGTGSYTNYGFFYFENCGRVRLSQSSAKRMDTILNLYNCYDSRCDDVFTEDCNASVAVVSDSTVTGGASRNVKVRRATILRGGDDGIAFLARGLDVIDCWADACYITKTTRSNGELDGSTLAATGLRAGRFGSAGSIIGGGFIRNDGVDMVSDFIRAHDCIDFSVDDNKCNGFAKRSVEACFQIGTGTANGFLRGTVCRNSGKGAVLSGRRVFFCQGMTYSLFQGNSGSASIGGDGTARFDNCSNVRILSNILSNTLAYGILLSATTSSCTVSLNDVSIFAAVGIADLGTSNRLIDNIGCPTKTNGSNIVPAGAAVRVVSHGIPPTNSAVPRITVQVRGAWGSATKMWVTNITASQFTVNTDQNPTSLDLAFDWFADKT